MSLQHEAALLYQLTQRYNTSNTGAVAAPLENQTIINHPLFLLLEQAEEKPDSLQTARQRFDKMSDLLLDPSINRVMQRVAPALESRNLIGSEQETALGFSGSGATGLAQVRRLAGTYRLPIAPDLDLHLISTGKTQPADIPFETIQEEAIALIGYFGYESHFSNQFAGNIIEFPEAEDLAKRTLSQLQNRDFRSISQLLLAFYPMHPIKVENVVRDRTLEALHIIYDEHQQAWQQIVTHLELLQRDIYVVRIAKYFMPDWGSRSKDDQKIAEIQQVTAPLIDRVVRVFHDLLESTGENPNIIT